MRARFAVRAITIAVLYASAVSLVSAARYLGCFSDRADVQHRALPLVQELSPEMTVEKCLNKCASLGLEYTGLEYKQECYCGSQPPPYEQLLESQCQVACGGGGDGKCGGALSLSVYQQSVTAPTFDAARPLLCLVMILKNEAHTVLNTLRTVKDAIDCWQILDTGSDDGTQKVIQEYFRENVSTTTGEPVPGQLHEEPFVDYGATRNRVLELAKEHSNPIFTLMLSADEAVRNADELREFLMEMRYARGTQHGAYPVVMNTGLKFDSIRIARVDSGWRYKGRVHEYLAPPEGPYVGLYRSSVPFDVKFTATDGDRRFASQFFIRRILEEDLAKNPNDTRSMYYLARTNSGISNHSEAYRYYDMLSKKSHWDEEIYHGMVMKAIESKYLDVDWHERQSMLLDAYAYKPNNMDALHALAQDHFDSGRFQLAYIFALRAVQLPVPPGLAAIENVLLRPTKYLYDYEGHRLLGFASREIGDWHMCVQAFRHVLRAKPDDTIVQDRIQLCEKQAAAEGKYVQPEVHPEPIGAAKAAIEPEEVQTRAATPVADIKQRAGRARARAAPSPRIVAEPSVEVAGMPAAAAVHAAGLPAQPLPTHLEAVSDGTLHVDLSYRYVLIMVVFVFAGLATCVVVQMRSTEKKARSY